MTFSKIMFLLFVPLASIANGQYYNFSLPPGYGLGLWPYSYGYGYNSGSGYASSSNYVRRSPPLSPEALYDRKVRELQAKQKYDEAVVEDALARKERELETAKRWKELEDRQEFYRQRGYLPPKRPTQYIAYGKAYSSFAEFAKTPDYQKLVAEGEARERESLERRSQEKLRYNVAVEFDRKWRGMSESEKSLHNTENAVIDSLKRDIVSGRYSPQRTEEMLDLLTTLISSR